MNEYLLDPNVCPSSLGEDDLPMTEGETAHKWDEETGLCNECGAEREYMEIEKALVIMESAITDLIGHYCDTKHDTVEIEELREAHSAIKNALKQK